MCISYRVQFWSLRVGVLGCSRCIKRKATKTSGIKRYWNGLEFYCVGHIPAVTPKLFGAGCVFVVCTALFWSMALWALCPDLWDRFQSYFIKNWQTFSLSRNFDLIDLFYKANIRINVAFNSIYYILNHHTEQINTYILLSLIWCIIICSRQ